MAALTKGSASITVTSGALKSTQSVSSAGVHLLAFPMGVGMQAFSVITGEGSGSAIGAIDISGDCYVRKLFIRLGAVTYAEQKGEYNFNILAGKVNVNATNIGLASSLDLANPLAEPLALNSTTTKGGSSTGHASHCGSISSKSSGVLSASNAELAVPNGNM